ncbi:hypothetical protein AMATHDRAFT_70943 [Amanita thiersii Skay4041]|uniref:non-specific serine/threonine protein kinase n=1 Tax=Amanita thiersii Skay4041 TaxID=703135 RepID=A0A2A9NDV4_9AGAR|nr:hypothetical protein AMATHDRAFT_70943 [Amanita thiersii Skay4041]
MAQPTVHQLYQRLETVGKGAYGSVHKGKDVQTGNIVALKIINLDTPDDDVGDIQREVALLTQLRDAPNVTRYYGCHLDGPRVWIVMEYAQGGSVLSLMKASRDGCLEEKYVSVIVREVLTGLSYLHKVPVIHRDIKAANILVTASGKVMICDFGVSALLATASSKRNTLTGTPYWMAPEVVQSAPAYDTKADIWSLGIMIYEMIKGSPPHSDLDKFKVMDLIPRIKPPRLFENDGSRDMRDFMGFCLKEIPSERLSADELMKVKWIKSTKVPVTILIDLIARLQQVKQRDSLSRFLDWEEDEAKDDNESIWEFETVKGIPASRPDLLTLDDITPAQTTIRPQPLPGLPSSLRWLFSGDQPNDPQMPRNTSQVQEPTAGNYPEEVYSTSEIQSQKAELDLPAFTNEHDGDDNSARCIHAEAFVRQRPSIIQDHEETMHNDDEPSNNAIDDISLVQGLGMLDHLTSVHNDKETKGLHFLNASVSSNGLQMLDVRSSLLSVHRVSQSLDNSCSLLTPDDIPVKRGISHTRATPVVRIPETLLPGNTSGDFPPENHVTHLGTPGLRDVLKMPSITTHHQYQPYDLLPPSPFLSSRPQLLSHTSLDSARHHKDELLINSETQRIVAPGRESIAGSQTQLGIIQNTPGDHSGVQYLGSHLLHFPNVIIDGSARPELLKIVDDLSQLLVVVESGLDTILHTQPTSNTSQDVLGDGTNVL